MLVFVVVVCIYLQSDVAHCPLHKQLFSSIHIYCKHACVCVCVYVSVLVRLCGWLVGWDLVCVRCLGIYTCQVMLFGVFITCCCPPLFSSFIVVICCFCCCFSPVPLVIHLLCSYFYFIFSLSQF